jgi:hypothetical protein
MHFDIASTAWSKQAGLVNAGLSALAGERYSFLKHGLGERLCDHSGNGSALSDASKIAVTKICGTNPLRRIWSNEHTRRDLER